MHALTSSLSPLPLHTQHPLVGRRVGCLESHLADHQEYRVKGAMEGLGTLGRRRGSGRWQGRRRTWKRTDERALEGTEPGGRREGVVGKRSTPYLDPMADVIQAAKVEGSSVVWCEGG